MKITKLKNGKYSTKIYLGNINGKEIQKRISGDSEKEVKALVKKAKASFLLESSHASKNSITLREAIDDFIASRNNILSQTTLRAYISIRDNSFLTIIDMPLIDITNDMVQREVNSMALNLAPKTVKNKVSLFISVYNKYCESPKKFEYNMPPKRKTEVYIPTKDDVDKLVQFCHSDPYYCEYELPILLGAYCGLRRGEICALTYKDINLDSKTVSISKAVVLNTDREMQIKQPKTYAGYRVLNLTDYMADLIVQRKKNKKDLIAVNIEQITSVFPTIIKKCGIEHFRFHDLRHFFASTLLALNVPDLYAIQLTGHSTTNMLKTVYQHTFKDKEDEYKQKILDSFNGNK